ncbi:MAG: DUF6273 domain-containing protein, partial [Clostridia bacterium]
ADAWSSYSYDLIFLLSIEEASRVKSDFGSFLTASPTAEAVNSNEAYIEDLSADRTSAWWLRDSDPLNGYSYNVRLITSDGWVHAAKANNPANGIRPAFYLNMDLVQFIGGDGSRADPYRVKSHSFGEWKNTTSPGCTQPGTRQRECAECGEIETESIPSSGHKLGEERVLKIGIFGNRVTSRTCDNCGLVYIYSKTGLWPVILGGIVIAFVVISFLRRRKP